MMKSKMSKILYPNFGRRKKDRLVDPSTTELTIISTSAMKRAQLLQEEFLRVNGVRVDVFQLAKELSI